MNMGSPSREEILQRARARRTFNKHRRWADEMAGAGWVTEEPLSAPASERSWRIDSDRETVTVTRYCYTAEIQVFQAACGPYGDDRPTGGRAKISLSPEQIDEMILALRRARAGLPASAA